MCRGGDMEKCAEHVGKVFAIFLFLLAVPVLFWGQANQEPPLPQPPPTTTIYDPRILTTPNNTYTPIFQPPTTFDDGLFTEATSNFIDDVKPPIETAFETTSYGPASIRLNLARTTNLAFIGRMLETVQRTLSLHET